jgi:predicted O-methyltransferase YrrM
MVAQMLKRFARGMKRVPRFPHLSRNVLEVADLDRLKKAMGWESDPVLEGDHLREFKYFEDLNDRRLRDAEIIGAACCNRSPQTLVEIGTAFGHTTALMAMNAPQGIVHTVNIPPEEITRGGRHISFAPSREEIGRYYREKRLANVRQIFANTATWQPDFQRIDVAFIDGCHDTKFVFNDTRKLLKCCGPGSIILWHDFAPQLASPFPWIASVCKGIDQLFARGLLNGRILHLRDSWVGLYRVPGEQ